MATSCREYHKGGDRLCDRVTTLRVTRSFDPRFRFIAYASLTSCASNDFVVLPWGDLRCVRYSSTRLNGESIGYHRGRVGAARKVDDPARSAIGATTWSFP